MKTRMLLVAATLVMILGCGVVYAETVTGVATSMDDFKTALADWRFQMVNTSHRAQTATYGPHNTFGHLLWCMAQDSPVKIKYAYTYGEPNTNISANKCGLAFRTIPGPCTGPLTEQVLDSNSMR
jgi:hypothetical protein